MEGGMEEWRVVWRNGGWCGGMAGVYFVTH